MPKDYRRDIKFGIACGLIGLVIAALIYWFMGRTFLDDWRLTYADATTRGTLLSKRYTYNDDEVRLCYVTYTYNAPLPDGRLRPYRREDRVDEEFFEAVREGPNIEVRYLTRYPHLAYIVGNKKVANYLTARGVIFCTLSALAGIFSCWGFGIALIGATQRSRDHYSKKLSSKPQSVKKKTSAKRKNSKK